MWHNLHGWRVPVVRRTCWVYLVCYSLEYICGVLIVKILNKMYSKHLSVKSIFRQTPQYFHTPVYWLSSWNRNSIFSKHTVIWMGEKNRCKLSKIRLVRPVVLCILFYKHIRSSFAWFHSNYDIRWLVRVTQPTWMSIFDWFNNIRNVQIWINFEKAVTCLN